MATAPADPPRQVGLDAQAYRNAIAQLPTGVAVIAANGPAGPCGHLIGSLTSLSVDPPRVLVCLGKRASSHDALVASDAVSIAVLSDRDAGEATRFSRADRRAERFDPALWQVTGACAPLYARALVTLVGRPERRIDAGTHTIMLVAVDAVRTGSGTPMVSHDRHLLTLGAPV